MCRLEALAARGRAQVGGIKPGCFKIGNTGGMMDNILDSKLYRPGSVAYVSKSGGRRVNATPALWDPCTGLTDRGPDRASWLGRFGGGERRHVERAQQHHLPYHGRRV